MTTPVTTAADQSVKPLRLLFALAMLGYVALYLAFRFLAWIIPAEHTTLVTRSQQAGVLDLLPMALPLVAVLIATHIAPRLAAGKVLALVALVEYAVVLFLGGITFLIGLGGMGYVDTFPESIEALSHIVLTIARLGLVALAGYAVLRVFLSLGGRVALPTSLVPPA